MSKTAFAIASAAAIVGAAAIGPALQPSHAPTTSIEMRMEPAKDGARANTKADRFVWPEMDQKDVDAITAAIARMEKRDIVIFCQIDSRCGNLALDFDNAFESAKWKSRIETPLMDDTIGLASSDPEIAAMIEKATSGRLKPKVIAARPGANQAFVVIGKKPQ